MNRVQTKAYRLRQLFEASSTTITTENPQRDKDFDTIGELRAKLANDTELEAAILEAAAEVRRS